MKWVGEILSLFNNLFKVVGWFQSPEKKQETVQADQKKEEDQIEKALKEGDHSTIVRDLD